MTNAICQTVRILTPSVIADIPTFIKVTFTYNIALSVTGKHLRVCPQGLTCCTEEMEHNLSAQSRREFDRAVRDTLNKLGTLLKLRAQRFDGKSCV